MARNASVFAPTFDGERIVRIDDITLEPEVGRNALFRGMPASNAGVRSYLAAPVVGAHGDVIGALYFGHPDRGRFDERSELLIAGLAAQALTAIENARLYRAAQADIAERARPSRRCARARLGSGLATRAGKLGIWDWDIAKNHVAWTESLYAIFGVTKDDFDGTVEGFAKLVHPDDAERVRDAIDAALGGADYEVEFRTVRPDGTTVWLYTNAAVIHENGHPRRMLGCTLDITARKHAEAALRTSEAQFRTLADSIPQLAWMARPDGTVFWFNRRWYEFTGTTFDQVAGWGWSCVYDPGRGASASSIPTRRASRPASRGPKRSRCAATTGRCAGT